MMMMRDKFTTFLKCAQHICVDCRSCPKDGSTRNWDSFFTTAGSGGVGGSTQRVGGQVGSSQHRQPRSTDANNETPPNESVASPGPVVCCLFGTLKRSVCFKVGGSVGVQFDHRPDQEQDREIFKMGQRAEQSVAAWGRGHSQHISAAQLCYQTKILLSQKQRGEELEELVLELRGGVEDFLHLQIRTNLETS